jgi:hypothetical protein
VAALKLAIPRIEFVRSGGKLARTTRELERREARSVKDISSLYAGIQGGA